VVNSESWYPEKLKVSLWQNGRRVEARKYEDQDVVLFNNLRNGHEYKITIKRTDLKGIVLYREYQKKFSPNNGQTKYIVLVGASIGKAWKIHEIARRHNMPENVVIGSRAVYDFDKTTALKDLVELPVENENKTVIIKECAAYFPQVQKEFEEKIRRWIKLLRGKNIKTILATVVPITEQHRKQKPDRFESIMKYNDFIKAVSKENGITVMDLEKALHRSGVDRTLKMEYAQEDGLHLTRYAYDTVLDELALETFRRNNLL